MTALRRVRQPTGRNIRSINPRKPIVVIDKYMSKIDTGIIAEDSTEILNEVITKILNNVTLKKSAISKRKFLH